MRAPPAAVLPAAPGSDLDPQHRLGCHSRGAGVTAEFEPVMPRRQLQKGPAAVEPPEHPPHSRRGGTRLHILDALEIDRGDRQTGIAQMEKAELEARFVARA